MAILKFGKIHYWDGTKNNEWWESVKNDTDIYIYTPEQFAAISSSSGKVFHLMSDLYFNENFENNFDWADYDNTIKDSSLKMLGKSFGKCTFNGNFKKLVGLYNADTKTYAVLQCLYFGSSSILNLSIENSTIAGGACSVLVSSSNSIFKNVSFKKIKVTGNSQKYYDGVCYTAPGVWLSNYDSSTQKNEFLNCFNLNSLVEMYQGGGIAANGYNANMIGFIHSLVVDRLKNTNGQIKFSWAANCEVINKYGRPSFNHAEPVSLFNSSNYGTAEISVDHYGIYSANNTGVREPHFGEDVLSVSEIIDKVNTGLIAEQNPELSLLKPDGSFSGKNYLGEAISTAAVSVSSQTGAGNILKFGKSVLKTLKEKDV